MSDATDRLQARRAALLGRAEFQRLELRAYAGRIGAAADSADRGLGLVRKFAKPPILVAGGVAAALLLARGRGRKALATSLTVLGLFQRFRSARQVLAALTGGERRRQAVSRSR